MNLAKTSPCPCGSQKTYGNCCAVFHEGKNPATAEELLRSRYVAFTLGKTAYILETHHSETRSQVDAKEIEEWAKESQWLGLEIETINGGQASDSEAVIDFHARYQSKDGKEHDHHERSYFKKEKGLWMFYDAQAIQTGPFVREEPKTGRNDPCPCGSGKKFKKCHAA